jgi:hypothetical protein
MAMSAIGPKRTCTAAPHMSAFGGKADIGQPLHKCHEASFNSCIEAQPPEQAAPLREKARAALKPSQAPAEYRSAQQSMLLGA